MSSRRERGVSFVSILLVVGVAAGIYWIVVFGGPYIDNHELKTVVRQAANMAMREPVDERLREFIFRRADELFGYDVEEFGQRRRRSRIEFQPDDLVIERNKEPPWIKIRFSYTRTVQLPILGGERSIYFPIDVDQDLSPVKW